MKVEIDGCRYVEERPHKICSFLGNDIFYADILWDARKEFYNISVSYVFFPENGGSVFVGTDGRTILVKNATTVQPRQG